MTTLRLHYHADAGPERALPWALYDDTGSRLESGVGPAADWPAADAIEVIVAAAAVRLASVPLPPVPAARVAAAAAYALEDQLAGPAADLLLASGAQRPDGRVVVVIMARTLVSGLRGELARAGRLDRLERVVAEPALADAGSGWCWCGAPGGGFVRLADGSAFAVDAAGADGALPPTLALALAAATRAGTAPAAVRVDGAATDSTLARWREETGVPFTAGTPWRWDAVPATAIAGATNLLQGEFAPIPPQARGARMRRFAPALWLVVAALLLHVTATIGEWAWWRVEAWRAARAWTSLAASAGVPAADATTPASARAAIARRFADARHAQGLVAPNDALPLLARAAPALAGLPPGVLKSATFTDEHWTLDLQRAEPALIGNLDTRLRNAGAPAIIATTPAGTRVRFGAY